MANLFAHFTQKGGGIYFPGAPFILGAILMLISTIIAYYVFKSDKHKVAPKENELVLEGVEEGEWLAD